MEININILITAVLTSTVFSGLTIYIVKKMFSHYLDERLLKREALIDVDKDISKRIKQERLEACKSALELSAKAKDICNRCISLIAYSVGVKSVGQPHFSTIIATGSQDIKKELNDNCQELKTTLSSLNDVYYSNALVVTGNSMSRACNELFESYIVLFANDVAKFKEAESKEDREANIVLLDSLLVKYYHIDEQYNSYSKTLKEYYKKYE